MADGGHIRVNGERVAIVGAGPGGLAAAMLLSAQGMQVTVYEKQHVIGGRCSRVTIGDFSFDRGPTFLMMPALLEELFQMVERNVHDYVDMVELDPLYRLDFGEVKLEPTLDRAKMKDMLSLQFPDVRKDYEAFLAIEGRKFEHVMPLLQRPFSSLRDYARLDVLRALPHLNAVQSVHKRLSRYFGDDRLRAAFSFQAKYLGMSPWECPGTFTILSYLEHQYGLFHPIGGVNRICHAMAAVVEEFGGQIEFGAGVDEIVVQGRQAQHLRLSSGHSVEFDHLVINAEFATAMTKLFKPGALRKHSAPHIDKKKFSCSTFMLYLGVNREIDLPHHTIFFAEDYFKNVREITKLLTLSEDPSIYVHNPSRIDPTLAPPGKSSLYVLMPCPNLRANIDWDAVKNDVRNAILDRLEQEPELTGLRADIEVEAVYTPMDWAEDLDVFLGATFSMAHSLDQMMARRPHNKFEELDNCYLVGGGTHPGSGLPTIFESAKISARLLLEASHVSRP